MLKRLITLVIVVGIIAAVVWYFFLRETPEESPEVTPASPAAIKTVREAKIHDEFMVRQLSIDLETDVSIVLTLANGDKVDGYFYLESGDNIGFKITGSSPVYQSKPPDADTKNITSDRFSFTASQAQGLAYTLTLSAAGIEGEESGGATVFMEIIYPASGSLYVPIGTK